MIKLISSLALISGVMAQRTITVYNACPFTVWPAMFTGAGALPDYSTGWEAAEYTAVTFQVPSNWSYGTIWARRDCDFNTTDPGASSCIDGGCFGGLECSTTNGTATAPASLAQFNLNADGLDFYYVDLSKGYNLPVSITNTVGCSTAQCAVDLGPNCPASLIGPYDTTGYPVGCKSACEANLDGNPTNSPNCCTGQYDTPATCPSSGVVSYSYFKEYCPDSFCYAFDDSAIYTCPSDIDTVYTVTFCPAT